METYIKSHINHIKNIWKSYTEYIQEGMQEQRKSTKSIETAPITTRALRAPVGRGRMPRLWLLIRLIFFVFSQDCANICIRRHALLWISSSSSTIIIKRKMLLEILLPPRLV